MQIRLPQILLAMALILLAGLAAVAFFEARGGGAAVPSFVVLAQPELDGVALTALAEALPGARVESVPAGEAPLAPFDDDALGLHVSRGYDTVLFAPGGPPAPELHWARRALVYPELSSKDAFGHALDDTLFELRSHSEEDPFLVGVLADPLPAARVERFLRACRDALADRDPYLRGAVVLLGARDGERRVVLRIDVGRWGNRGRPALTDLLEPRW